MGLIIIDTWSDRDGRGEKGEGRREDTEHGTSPGSGWEGRLLLPAGASCPHLKTKRMAALLPSNELRSRVLHGKQGGEGHG